LVRSSAGFFVCGIVDGDGATERIAAGVEAVVAGKLLPALGESGAHPA
jgi:hypothetical protein